MDRQHFDIIVIGAGPAGYVCAIRCSQLGMSVACIDQTSDKNNKPSPGGTCLNVGCIPSKALLDSSHHYDFINHHAGKHGINVKESMLDLDKMQQRKEKVVKTLTTGVKGLLKKNNVAFYHGAATFTDANTLTINNEQEHSVSATTIIIATGSKPCALPFAEVDQVKILDSTGALSLAQVPKHLGIIGAGVIGLEMASIWSRLGAAVTVWESADQFLPSVDEDISTQAKKIISKQGIDINLGCTVESLQINDGRVALTVASQENKSQTEVDCLLVATGRRANTDGLGLDGLNIELDDKGFIVTNQYWQTSIENIYAIGDVIGGAMLAHKSSDEGIALAEHLAGQYGHVNYAAVPWVIYTWPEIAWAGQTEQQLINADVKYRKGQFPFMALGRARAMGETEGMIKLLSDADTDTLLGAHIIGPNASELIAEAVIAIESELTAEDLARSIHAHPTLSEGLHEAALDVDDRAIHI